MNKLTQDILPNGEKTAIELFTYSSDTTMAFAHYHDHYEILYMVKGKRNLIVNDYKSYILTPDSIAIIPPGYIHRTESIDNEYQTRILIAVSEDLVNEIMENTSQNILLCSRVIVTEFDEKCKKSVKGIIESLSMLNKEDLFYSEYIKILISLLFVTISDYDARNYSMKQINLSPNRNTSETMKAIIAYLQENAYKKTSLDTIAETFYMQKNYLSRCFKKYTGTTITDYVNDIRLAKVQQLLTEGNISITKIAEITGFNSRAYLERVFKKKMGKTPKEFQISIRQERKKVK